MTLKDEVRGIVIKAIDGYICGKEVLMTKQVDQATEAIMEKIAWKIKNKKTYFTSNAQYYTREDFVRGYNEALDDLLTELGGTK